MSTLAEILEVRTAEAAPELVEPSSGTGSAVTRAATSARFPTGAVGVCKVRFNRGGRLHVPWGYVGGIQCDPIEKKPFFHARPGALAFSFGMLGCDLHCCVLPELGDVAGAPRSGGGCAAARRRRRGAGPRSQARSARSVVVSTYNEPLITSEWAVAIFKEARAAGL